MAAVGAELPHLQVLHKTFNEKAQHAIEIKTQIQGHLDSATWTGHYSQGFRTDWHQYSANLDRLHHALTGAAQDVRVNHNNIAEATGEAARI